MLCRDRTWTPSSMGQGKDWDRGTGRAPWGAGTGSDSTKAGGSNETPKQLCSEVLGRNNVPGGGRTLVLQLLAVGQTERCSTSPSFCAIRAMGASEGAVPRLPGWAHSDLGAQYFWAPESPPPLVCKAQL